MYKCCMRRLWSYVLPCSGVVNVGSLIGGEECDGRPAGSNEICSSIDEE